MLNAHRQAGVSGLVFVVGTVGGFTLQPGLDFDAPAARFARDLAAGESSLLASGLLLAIAAVGLAWFLAALGRVLDPQAGQPASAALAPAGAAAAALLALGFLGVAALAGWHPAAGADPAALQAVARLANAATNVALLPLAAGGIAVAILARSTAAVPAWTGWLGAVAAVVSVVAAGRAADELGFLALLLWLVWAAALAVRQLAASSSSREERNARSTSLTASPSARS